MIKNLWKFVIPLIAIIGFTAPLLLKQPELSLLSLYIAVPFICAPLLFFKIKHGECSSEETLSRNFFTVANIIYFVLYTITILLLESYQIRTYTYYLLIALMATVIILEIMLIKLKNTSTYIIIFQISILILNIIWGVNLRYYYFIGRTDPIAHIWLINNLLQNGHVTNIFNMYQQFPLWHIYCVIAYYFASSLIDINHSCFFLGGIIYAIIPMVTYLLAKKIIKDEKIALLISLFTSLNPDILFYGMEAIPRSIISVMLIFLLLLFFDNKKNIYKSIVLILITVSMILYHPVSMPFVVIILILILCLCIILKIKNRPEMTYLLMVIVTTLSYWMYNAVNIFDALIKDVSLPPPAGILTKSLIYVPLNEVFNYLQYTPIIFLIIYGVYYIYNSRKGSSILKVFILAALVLIPISFPGPALLLNKLSQNLNLDRFIEYTFIFISFAAAIGFYHLFYDSKKYFRILSIILFMIMIFLAVSNDFTASDNPIIKRTFFTFYLTQNEVVSFNTIASFADSYILSDYVTDRYYTNSMYSSIGEQMLEVSNGKFLRNSSKDILLIRSQELQKRPLQLYSSKKGTFQKNVSLEQAGLDYYYNGLLLWNTLQDYNTIYDSGDVAGYI